MKHNPTLSRYPLPRMLLLTLLALTILLPAQAALPAFETEVIATGLERPWDLAQLPDGSLLFTQRGGALSVLREGQVQHIADIPGVAARGEGGLTGLALDTDFADNRLIYLTYNTQIDGVPEVRVTRWRLSETLTLEDPVDIVTGIPAVSGGRHSGTQLEMGKNGTLWIGTGDAATANNPQDPMSLGGKILRVTRDGVPAEGNLLAPFDPRVFSYGHRNTQGLTLFDAPDEHGSWGYSAEHGSWQEDEVNRLVPGNFGWAPRPTYDESVPMTDTRRFPDAVVAVWNSGPSTIATSGLTRLLGAHWGDWEGALALGVQKGQHLRLLRLYEGRAAEEAVLLEGQFGRLRAAVLGHDGMLYLGTGNGRDDKIIRVTPAQ